MEREIGFVWNEADGSLTGPLGAQRALFMPFIMNFYEL